LAAARARAPRRSGRGCRAGRGPDRDGGRGASSTALLADDMTPEQRSRYGDLVHAVITQQAAYTRSGMSAERAARVTATATTTARPRTRYMVGRDASILSLLAFIVPDRTLDRILAWNL